MTLNTKATFREILTVIPVSGPSLTETLRRDPPEYLRGYEVDFPCFSSSDAVTAREVDGNNFLFADDQWASVTPTDFSSAAYQVYPSDKRRHPAWFVEAAKEMLESLGYHILKTEDDRATEHWPKDTLHEAAKRVVEGAKELIPEARGAVKGAIDKANAPPTGRAASDNAIGRATRFGGDQNTGRPF